MILSCTKQFQCLKLASSSSLPPKACIPMIRWRHFLIVFTNKKPFRLQYASVPSSLVRAAKLSLQTSSTTAGRSDELVRKAVSSNVWVQSGTNHIRGTLLQTPPQLLQ